LLPSSDSLPPNYGFPHGKQKTTSNNTPSAPLLAASNQLIIARDKIKQYFIIMQENRSLDEYFGTYPGAEGIPMQNGVRPSVLLIRRQADV